jgi:hypothetical protein
MATARGIDENGNVVWFERPTTSQVLDAMLETRRANRHALEVSLLQQTAGVREEVPDLEVPYIIPAWLRGSERCDMCEKTAHEVWVDSILQDMVV